MQEVSTFTDESDLRDVHVESIEVFRDEEFSEAYDWDGEVIKDWMPGHDIFFRLTFPDLYDDELYPVINWYCSGSHFRGALLDINRRERERKTIVTGKVDGQLVRDKIDIKVLLVDSEGYVHSIESKRKIILEGNKSFFPTSVEPFNSYKEMKDAFCHVAMSIDTDPNELFSISNCRAVFNKESSLYDEEKERPATYMPTDYFALYEIWRQMIEIALSNEEFDEYLQPEESDEDDVRIGVVWSNILQQLFPGKELSEIRTMRNQNYWRFCSIIQSEFLKGCQGI